jgi:hypothetical protein
MTRSLTMVGWCAMRWNTEAHAGSLQAVGQAVGSLVLAGDADQRGRRAQRGNVQGNVGRAAGRSSI